MNYGFKRRDTMRLSAFYLEKFHRPHFLNSVQTFHDKADNTAPSAEAGLRDPRAPQFVHVPVP